MARSSRHRVEFNTALSVADRARQASPQRSSLEANATSYSNRRRGGGKPRGWERRPVGGSGW
jgi:hypothetical protein